MHPIYDLPALAFFLVLVVAGVAQVAPQPPQGATEPADLAVAATAAGVRRPGGWDLTWRVAVSNDGPGPAAALVVEAIADESLRPWLADLHIDAGEGGACAAAAMTCRFPELAAGGSLELRVHATLTAAAARRSAGLEFRVDAATQDAAPCDNRYYSTTFLE